MKILARTASLTELELHAVETAGRIAARMGAEFVPHEFLVAETFEEHMHPDVNWIEDPAFARAFDDIANEEYMAAYTKPEPTYPGFINVSIAAGTAVIVLRGDPPPCDLTNPIPQMPAPTVQLEIPADEWDSFVARLGYERRASA